MYYTPQSTVFLDGEWINPKIATADPYSQSLHYGNAAFEGIRSYETHNGFNVFKSKEHYERLVYSAEKMHLKLNYSVQEMMEITDELLEKNQLTDAYIRPLVFSGQNMSLSPSEEGKLFMAAWVWGKLLSDGLDIMTSSYQRPNPKSTHIQAKISGHYVNSILATKEAKSKGFDEGLLLDQNEYVAEGPGANFFYEKNGELFTAPLGNILSGITRITIMELAISLNIKVNETLFKPEDVYQADAAFFTGTAAEVAHINSLDGNKFPLKWEESIGYKLSQLYSKLVRTSAN